MRTSAGFCDTGLSGKMRMKMRPPRFTCRVIARRAASICLAVRRPRVVAFRPYSPNETLLPRVATPLLRPFCCFRYLVRDGWSMGDLGYSFVLRDFFTAVFGSAFVSVLGFASPAAFFAGAFARGAGAALGLGVSAAASVAAGAGAGAAATAGSSFSSTAGAFEGAFFTFLVAGASSEAGIGGTAGWSVFAITSPLYTHTLMPMTP